MKSWERVSVDIHNGKHCKNTREKEKGGKRERVECRKREKTSIQASTGQRKLLKKIQKQK